MREIKVPTLIQQFSPDAIYPSVWSATVQSGLLPLRDRRITNLIRASQTQPAEYFIRPEGQQMVEDVSQYAYTKLEDFFKFCSRTDQRNETAYSAYRTYMGIANQAVHSLIEELAPDQKSKFTPKNAIDFIPEPGEVVKLLSMPKGTIDETFRFEVARQVLLALSAAQLETQTYELKKRLGEVQLLVDTKMFNHGQPLGSGIDKEVIYFTDPHTNEVVSASTATKNPEVASFDTLIRKSTPISMRYTPGEIGLVHTDPRFKADGSALNKGLREALRQQSNGNEGRITSSSLNDAAGMRFIVANEFSSEGKNVRAFIQEFTGILKDHYGDSVTFEESENNKGKPNQSAKFKTRKVYVTFNDGIKIEVMFLGIGDHLNNENRIGEYNSFTGTFNGQAHALYSVNRNVELMKLYFPKELYGDYNEASLLAQSHQKIARNLLLRDRI